MDLLISSVADRPDLAALPMGTSPWPVFMTKDPISDLYYDDPSAAYPEFCFVAVDRDQPERAVARAHSVPFTWAGDPAADLPADGFDGVILRAARDRLAGTRGNLVSALEIAIRPDLRGGGLSGRMLDAMRRGAAAQGFQSLVAPVRPNAKHRHPHLPMAEYVRRTRDDGLPEDPWLRVHVRAGGTVVSIAPLAMVIPGTLAQWREWTGLPFDTTGPVVVPEALVPVHCDVENDHAVYVEPGVWVHHGLTDLA